MDQDSADLPDSHGIRCRHGFRRKGTVSPAEMAWTSGSSLRRSGELDHSLCIGEKNTSDTGAALVHLYCGTGFPCLDLQLRVTLPFTTGFPVRVQTGGEGGTVEGRRTCQMIIRDHVTPR